MDSKKIRKTISRFFGWLGLSLCLSIIKVLPWNWLYGFAQGLAKGGYRIARKQRKIALDSLAIAFGKEKTAQEITQIAKDCFVFMAKAGAELFFLLERPALLKERVRIQGRKHLDSALAKGKGVILVSAHFGNFPLILARLSIEGYRTAGIMRPMRDKRVEKIFLEKRELFNIRAIYSQPRKACVENTLRSLRNNEVLFIPVDQNSGTGGVFVNFFGRKAATASGPVILGQRTKAAILPCFIVRQKDDTHDIIFEPALTLEESGSQQENVIKNVQKITEIVECYIRRYPAEWGWIHRRWKTQPSAQ